MPGLAPATELFENDEMHQKEGVLGKSPEGRNEDKPFSASMVTKKWIVFCGNTMLFSTLLAQNNININKSKAT